MPTLTWTYTDLIAAPGDPIDFEVFDEIQSNVNLINAVVGGQYGASTFNGPTGRAITLTPAEADANYVPCITATAATGGNLGEVYIGNITVNGFTVYNTGSFTGAFRYKVLR